LLRDKARQLLALANILWIVRHDRFHVVVRTDDAMADITE
jgi:hypothetical protein